MIIGITPKIYSTFRRIFLEQKQTQSNTKTKVNFQFDEKHVQLLPLKSKKLFQPQIIGRDPIRRHSGTGPTISRITQQKQTLDKPIRYLTRRFFQQHLHNQSAYNIHELFQSALANSGISIRSIAETLPQSTGI